MTIARPRSREVTEGAARAPARSYLRAVGFSEDDFDKPQVAVASSWNDVTPCNYHLDKLAALAKEGVRQGGCVPLGFTTIAVSDGIAMGHEGMKASLMSRDLIADSVELMMHAERLDALVGIAGCDKSEPGMLMAMARMDLPSVYLYGGTILPGTYQGRDITIQDVFEAVGAHAKGQVTDAELLDLERAAGGPVRDERPGPGRRGARGHEGAARARRAPRRVPDGHRRDGCGEPGGAVAAGARRHRRASHVRPDPPRGRDRDPPRVART